MQAFDAKWRKRVLVGDTAAIRALSEATLAPLYQFAYYRLGRDHHLSEEVAQETLVRALRSMRNYDPSRCAGDPLPWLYGLARNEIRRTLSAEMRLRTAWEELDRDLLTAYARIREEPLAEEVMAREQTQDFVNATMAQLPSEYRAALEGKYVEMRSVRSLADAWMLSEKAAESRVFRARQAFRTTFLALTRNPACLETA